MSQRNSIEIKARRTELSDAQEIAQFVNKTTSDTFGPNIKETGKIFELIEKSILSITLEDESDNRILAQGCFYDYPNVNGVAAHSWESWLNKFYNAGKQTSLNTLFLHFFASQSEFSIGCAQEIVKSAFRAVSECHYIILCIPTNVTLDSAIVSLFTEMTRTIDSSSHVKQNFIALMANREKFIPLLHIRDANVNDNDDLTPLFNSYTELLKFTYGDFYIAEMIEAQNENNKCLTAEANGFGIAFMAITNDVNVNLLNECFELGPFHGLSKPHPDDILKLQVDADSNYESTAKISNESAPEFKHKLSDAGIVELDDLEDENANLAEESQNRIITSRKSETQSQISQYSSESTSNGQSRKESTEFIPKYLGESNAFAIQLFCIEEKYESRSLDFLPKAFEAFPEKDYCIITLPPSIPEFAMIQNFIKIAPRNTNKLNQELYLFHRDGLVKSFIVREANQSSDYTSVEKLVNNIKTKEKILYDLNINLKSRKDSNGVNVQAYVAEVLGRIVGIAIIRQEKDIEYLRSNYNLDDFIYYTHHKREEHGHLNHFSLVPIFSFMTKYFIREILRKSSKTCLYYPIYPEYAPNDIQEKYSLVTSLNFMVPIRKRNQIEYNYQKLGVNLPSDLVLRQKYNYMIPCALNHINRKLLLEPKIAINLRIVVVGASDVGISFLETLTFSPHLKFNNITLVSSNGLPGMLAPDSLRDNIRAQNLNYTQTDHAHLSLRSWINVIIGKLTSIDRRKKVIRVNGQTILPYDHLILCTGEQYYFIAPMSARIYNSYSKQEVKPHIHRPLFDSPPSNMFVINNEYEAEHVLIYMENNNLIASNENIIIYGLDLDVLCAIQTLIKFGIDSKRISIFCDKDAIKCLNNPFLISKITAALKELNITINESYQMQEWNGGKWSSAKPIKSIYFVKQKTPNDDPVQSPRKMLQECCLLLCYYKKDVDYTTFIASNQSHLVYDGRLVIDNDFHTNDACIRAAGRMTKYKRSYFVDTWSNACFNQKEIGADLAYKILKLVDPTLVSDKEDEPESVRLSNNDPNDKVLITLYKKPIIQYAILPGEYYYLNVAKPGLFIPYEEEKNDKGEELITNTEYGYFRIYLDKHKIVQTITCLSKNKFSAANICKIHGLHEQYLNKMLLKYTQKSIKDFYTYFNENWCIALYHDRFEDLCKEIRELSLNSVNGLTPVNDLLKEQVDKDLILTNVQRNSVNDYFKKSQTKSLVEKRLLNYLNYNSNHLPMFAKPDLV